MSWLAVYAFMTVVIARGLATFPVAQAYALAALCALVLFASVVAHELGHALVARRFGVRTGAITLFLFGGVALLEDEPATPRADALIALAGPAISAIIAVLALAGTYAIDRFGPATISPELGVLCAYLAVANGVLAGFNLIPAYPMDGGRVLRALLWHQARDRARATVTAARVGVVFALVFVAVGVLLAAAKHDVFYGWPVVLGVFLLRLGWSQERAHRAARTRSPELPAVA